jgi:AbrB family looped-hinge helix DNA binding protein
MTIVTVKKKYQVVIPRSLRGKLALSVGDLLEARVERGKITFTPKALVDRGIARSLADFKRRDSYGPFETAAELTASLEKETRILRSEKSKRSAR